MNDKLAYAIALAADSLMAKREAEAQKKEAERQERIAMADEHWAKFEECARSILPEYVFEYFSPGRSPENPEHGPGDWVLPTLDIPGLSLIRIVFVRQGSVNAPYWILRSNRAPFEYQNTFTVETKYEYEDDEDLYYVRTWGKEGWGHAWSLDEVLALALEAGQRQAEVQAEVNELNRKHREWLAEHQVRGSVAEQPMVKEVPPLERIAAALELIAAG